MTDENEKLSALLDDELDLRGDSTIDGLLGDVNLQYRARRYQMIGEALRHGLPGNIDLDFRHRVMEKISQQTAVQVAASESSSAGFPLLAWLGQFALKPVAGVAVAAAVAVVTVTLWNPQEGQQGGLNDETVASADTRRVQQYSQQQIAPVLPASTSAVSNGMQWQVDRGSVELQNKLNDYLLNHNEYSKSVQGFIPQARVAGFDSE